MVFRCQIYNSRNLFSRLDDQKLVKPRGIYNSRNLFSRLDLTVGNLGTPDLQ